MKAFEVLNQDIIACTKCPRLVAYLAEVARIRRRAYRDWDYWAKPVPGFGDPDARLLLVGLAPGAHGANRTGRPFTGDRSGEFLYKVMYDTGFASQPSSVSSDDGLELRDCYIGAAIRCAPPDNKPLPEEIRNCRSFLERELALLKNLQVVVALGRLAFDAYLSVLHDQRKIARRGAFTFSHNAEHKTGERHPILIGSYHPSQQNTSTGKLTEKMMRAVFERAKRHLHS